MAIDTATADVSAHVTLANTHLEQSLSSEGLWRVVGKHIVADEDKQTFSRLANEWLSQTAFDSDPVEKFLHPAHFKIIGMGPKILPLILKEVEKMSGHWFVALDAISSFNPLQPEDENNLERTAQAWISWGRREKLI